MTAWTREHLGCGTRSGQGAAARRPVSQPAAPVDAQPHREVWTNPILWREVCTWAYGRKMIVIRLAYIVLFVMAVAGVIWGDRMAAAAAGRLGIPSLARDGVADDSVLCRQPGDHQRAGRDVDHDRTRRTSAGSAVGHRSDAPRSSCSASCCGVFWVTKEMIAVADRAVRLSVVDRVVGFAEPVLRRRWPVGAGCVRGDAGDSQRHALREFACGDWRSAWGPCSSCFWESPPVS